LNVISEKLGCQRLWWLGVFIAPNHFGSRWGGCWRWAHRTVRCATRQALFLVRCATTSPSHEGSELTRPLELCPLAAPDSPVPHRIVRCPSDFLLWLLLWHCSSVRVNRCADSRCSVGSPDSPMNYSGARLRFPESGWLTPVRSWCTGQSGAPFFSTL
jgi:hypothetical protein